MGGANAKIGRAEQHMSKKRKQTLHEITSKNEQLLVHCLNGKTYTKLHGEPQ